MRITVSDTISAADASHPQIAEFLASFSLLRWIRRLVALFVSQLPHGFAVLSAKHALFHRRGFNIRQTVGLHFETASPCLTC
jgi:hypothetical protein